jgi:hypothetical protein
MSEMEIASQEQRIRERAYAIWEGEGRPAGRAEAHWLQAEAEIACEPARPNGETAQAGAARAAARAPNRPAATAKKREAAAPAASKRRTKT